MATSVTTKHDKSKKIHSFSISLSTDEENQIPNHVDSKGNYLVTVMNTANCASHTAKSYETC